jgi:hypothetical protein
VVVVYVYLGLLRAVVILLVIFLVAYCTVLYFLIVLYCVVIAASEKIRFTYIVSIKLIVNDYVIRVAYHRINYL